jgi:tetraacyldisaccharide 4'-kinase
LKQLRFLLFPFSAIYFLITSIRNYLYDSGIFKTYSIPIKSICIGNLSLGGTGKSPTTLFLIDKLKEKYKIETLSRGYGRKTKGYIKISEKSTALDVGDEPLMFFKRFEIDSNVGVNVCESRVEGVQKIISNHNPDLILLDDAFQHRKIKAGLNILITDFNKLYCEDYIFPVGTLREAMRGRNRADLIIVSKSPDNLTENAKEKIKQKLKFKAQNIYFSSIIYQELVSISKTTVRNIEHILLVTGIAHPQSLLEYLSKKYKVELLQFPDHHNFSVEDMHRINKKFDTFADGNKAIVTSEKDYMRLVASQFSPFLAEKPWYYQKISIQIDKEKEFLEKINTYLT